MQSSPWRVARPARRVVRTSVARISASSVIIARGGSAVPSAIFARLMASVEFVAKAAPGMDPMSAPLMPTAPGHHTTLLRPAEQLFDVPLASGRCYDPPRAPRSDPCITPAVPVESSPSGGAAPICMPAECRVLVVAPISVITNLDKCSRPSVFRIRCSRLLRGSFRFYQSIQFL